MCTLCVQASTEAEEDIKLPETGAGSCGLPEVGARKQTVTLCQSTMLSTTVSCLFPHVCPDLSLAALTSSRFTEYSRALVEQREGGLPSNLNAVDLRSPLFMPWLAWKITEISLPLPTSARMKDFCLRLNVKYFNTKIIRKGHIITLKRKLESTVQLNLLQQ